MGDNSRTYRSTFCSTFSFSSVNWRLVAERLALTDAPNFALSLSWASDTLSQTSACERWARTATFRSLECRRSAEDRNRNDGSSSPVSALLGRHLPSSTQNAPIGIFPDLVGTITSYAKTRS